MAELTEEQKARRKWLAEHFHEWGSEASPHLAERMRDHELTSAYLRRHPENIRLMEELEAMSDEEFEAYRDMPEDQRRKKFPWFFAAHESNPD